MKVLLVNNFYYDRGGDCTYMFSLKKILEKNGHKVIIFSMHHPKNFDSEYSRYFVSYIDYAEEVKNITPSSGLKVLSKTIFSKEAKKNIEKLILHEKPDIAHLQNIHHHITPSIFYQLKKHKIPIIWTLHDFTLICPNTTCLHEGKICEKCKKLRYFWMPIITKCKKGSMAASAMSALESLMHRVMKILDLVDIFITPSEFMRNKLIEYGFNKDKVICLNNFVDFDLSDERNNNTSDYCMYLGRISQEKGIKALIDAAIRLNTTKLKIVGDGPLREELLSYVKSIDGSSKIEFLGHKNLNEVIELLNNCKFLVVPSEWYENFPYSVLEAFAHEKPVIGSKIGGIPELVRDGKTGLLFELGNVDDLAGKMKYLYDNPDKAVEMGKNARTFVQKELNAEKHYQKLMEIYEQAIKNR